MGFIAGLALEPSSEDDDAISDGFLVRSDLGPFLGKDAMSDEFLVRLVLVHPPACQILVRVVGIL